jgi:tight adherence protein B
MPELSLEHMALLSSALLGLAVASFLIIVTPHWDRFTAWHLADLTARMRDLNMDTRALPGYLRVWAGAMVGTAAVGLALGYPALALPVLVLIYRAPRAVVSSLIVRRRILIRDQLVAGCVALANATRAGLALAQGIESVLPETPAPLRDELARIHREVHGGRPLAAAIRDARDRLALDSFTLFASALLVCMERGGKVTEALDRISKSLQENQRLERKLEADTASGNLVVKILALCPLGFLCLFGLMDPAGTSLLFTTVPGQVILLVAAALTFIAVKWAQAILDVGGGT